MGFQRKKDHVEILKNEKFDENKNKNKQIGPN